MTRIDKIVVATDFTSGSRRPLNFSLDLARKVDAELHLLYAYVERRFLYPDELRDRLMGMVPEETGDLQIHYHVDVGTAVAPCILDYTDQQQADVIVMGTRCPQSSTPGLLGDVTRKVLYQANAPVVTVDTVGDPPAPVASVLTPIDGSAVSVRVVETARRLAHRYDARLDLLHVITEPHFPDFYPRARSGLLEEAPGLKELAKRELMKIAEAAEGPRVAMRIHVGTGIPAEVILSTAEREGSGLLLMATRCCGERLPESNVTETVARYSSAPVFTIKTDTPGFCT